MLKATRIFLVNFEAEAERIEELSNGWAYSTLEKAKAGAQAEADETLDGEDSVPLDWQPIGTNEWRATGGGLDFVITERGIDV